MPFHPTSQGSWSLHCTAGSALPPAALRAHSGEFSASTAPAQAIIHLEQREKEKERERRLLFAEGCKPSPKLHTHIHSFIHSFGSSSTDAARKVKEKEKCCCCPNLKSICRAVGAHRHTVKLLLSVTQFGRVL